MDKELLKKAKKLIKDQYGEAFAKKATDEFCLHNMGAYAIPVARSFGAESLSAPSTSETPHSGVIMEFKEETVPKKTGQKESFKVSKIIAEFLDALKGEEKLTFDLQQFLRQQMTQAFREKIIKSIQPLNAFLERNIERAFAHGTRSLQQQPYLTKVCWLNQTMRTIADPGSLAEIAGDPQITKLDVPRKITREINDTGNTLFAPQYRHKFSQTGRGIIAAVIDSEIALNHNAFGNRVMHRSNYTKEP